MWFRYDINNRRFKSINCKNEIALCGGIEDMSNTPYLNYSIRKMVKFGNIELVDSLINDGLTDFLSKKHMGQLTEDIIDKYNITRRELDDYSISSYKNAQKNISKLKNEIIPIKFKNDVITEDEEILKIKI